MKLVTDHNNNSNNAADDDDNDDVINALMFCIAKCTSVYRSVQLTTTFTNNTLLPAMLHWIDENFWIKLL